MTRDSKKNKRLVALFLLGCILLNFPILSLVNLEILIFGWPLLYVYIFGVWCLLISLTALATVFHTRERTGDPGNTGGR
jgi:fatty acid desaturase